jgi:hypothetical protein
MSLVFQLVVKYEALLSIYENLFFVVIDITILLLDKKDFVTRNALIGTIFSSIKGSSISHILSVNLLKLVEKLLAEYSDEFYEISFGILLTLADKSLAFVNKSHYLYCVFLAFENLKERFTKVGLSLTIRLLGYDLTLDELGYKIVSAGVIALRPNSTTKFQADTKEIFVQFIHELFRYFSVSKRLGCPGFLELCNDVLDVVLSPIDTCYAG